MRSRTLLLSVIVVPTVSILSSLALGRPPPSEPSGDASARPEPLVGRIQLRAGTYDLTLGSLRADGPVRDVARGLAGVHADLSIQLVSEPPAEGASAAPVPSRYANPE